MGLPPQGDKVFYITNALYGLADAHARDEWWSNPLWITVDETQHTSAQISKAHIFPAVSCSNTKEAETKMPKMVRINGHLASLGAQSYDANIKQNYEQMGHRVGPYNEYGRTPDTELNLLKDKDGTVLVCDKDFRPLAGTDFVNVTISSEDMKRCELARRNEKAFFLAPLWNSLVVYQPEAATGVKYVGMVGALWCTYKLYKKIFGTTKKPAPAKGAAKGKRVAVRAVS